MITYLERIVYYITVSSKHACGTFAVDLRLRIDIFPPRSEISGPPIETVEISDERLRDIENWVGYFSEYWWALELRRERDRAFSPLISD